MADTDVMLPEKPAVENKIEQPKIAKLGKPERLPRVEESLIKDEIPESGIVDDKKVIDAKVEDKDNGSKPNEKTEKPQIDESLLKAYLESQGIKYEGLDKLKEKANYEPTVELTDAQKEEQSKAKEKRLLDLFVSGGGTAENYVAIKAIANSDLAELSNSALKKELKDSGFDEERIKDIIKNRYFQFADEEIEQEEDETEKEYKKRLKEYGANKLANRSLHTQKQAKEILDGLNKAIESEDLQKQNEAATSAKIVEHFKDMPRKLTFEIGKVDGKDITPVEYEVDETIVKEVESIFKNPKERNKILLNQDGSLNLTKIADVFTRNKYLESAIKAAYHEGGSRQVDEFRKTFGARNANEIGVGGAPNKQINTGKVAGFGKTQRVSR